MTKNTKYSIYIPSKGRAENCKTAEILEEEGLDFKLVVEPQDSEEYSKRFGKVRCVVMDKNDQGVAYVRNWIKTYSKAHGEDHHWQIDDNIGWFKVREKGKNLKSSASKCLSKVEEFYDSFENIGIAGLAHTAFAFAYKVDFGVNKQVYSCVLIRNDLAIKWRPDTVEDTDYSLQVLMQDKFKWCTVLFYKILIDKAKTMSMSGGNTDLEYKKGGREKRSLG